jgi:hypothetical protein
VFDFKQMEDPRRCAMLFVALMKARPATEAARIARRMEWQTPEGAGEVMAEYWLQTQDPAAIAVFTADHIGQIWAGLAGWDDVFDISVYPAVTAEEGLELLKQMPQQ